MHLKSKKRGKTGAFELKIQTESALFFPFNQADLCSLKLYPSFNPVRDELPTLSETESKVAMPIKNGHTSVTTKKIIRGLKESLYAYFLRMK